MKITFKNLEKSELAVEAIKERFFPLPEKFPNLRSTDIYVTINMDNSPTQGGLDVFGVTARINRGSYKGVAMTKSAPTLYLALAELIESIHERLKRFDEKDRKLKREQGREKKHHFINEKLSHESTDLTA